MTMPRRGVENFSADDVFGYTMAISESDAERSRQTGNRHFWQY